MISTGYATLGDAAVKKVGFYKNEKIAYFISSMMAGIFVGICLITILVMAGMFDSFAGIKILQGVSFAAAKEAMRLAAHKLPVKTKFVLREEG